MRTGFKKADGVVKRTEGGQVISCVSADDVRLDNSTGEMTVPMSVFVEEFDELDYVTRRND